MNSIDSGSSGVDISLTSSKLVITDDGKGFSDKREITHFFETFGQPHIAGDARFGRFRMGRGQLFAIGRNRWSSNQFVMDVDLKPQGEDTSDEFSLGYDLTEVPPVKAVPGCRIEIDLYERMNRYTLETTLRAITEHVLWSLIPVTLNGKVVSRNTAEAMWDLETPDAMIALRRKGQLSVYNMGVLVCSLPASKHGTGGDVVTREAIDVNFARNAIQSTCPVWRRIVKAIDARVGAELAKPHKMDDAGREMLARSVVDLETPFLQVLKQRLITDVTGSHRTLASLSPAGWGQVPVTVADTGDRIGDKIMQRKLALVLSNDTLERFGVDSLQELLDALKRAAEHDLNERGLDRNTHEAYQDGVGAFLRGLRNLKPVSMERLRKAFKEGHEGLDDASLKRGELLALQALRSGARRIRTSMNSWCKEQDLPQASERDIHAGLSETARGWTDGEHNIWIERRHLPEVRTAPGRLMLAGLLLHEFLHREPDTDTHVHDVEFYKLYHDLSQYTDVLHKGADMIRSALELKVHYAEKKAGADDPRALEDLDVPAPEIDRQPGPAAAM